MKIRSRIITGYKNKPVVPDDIIEMSDNVAKVWIKAGWGEAVKVNVDSPKKIKKDKYNQKKRAGGIHGIDNWNG